MTTRVTIHAVKAVSTDGFIEDADDWTSDSWLLHVAARLEVNGTLAVVEQKSETKCRMLCRSQAVVDVVDVFLDAKILNNGLSKNRLGRVFTALHF